jgi:hypothetical protein
VPLPGEEKRAQQRQWQDELARGAGATGWLDRGAWGAAGQRAPGTWSWPRALMQLALTVVGIVLVTLVIDISWATVVGVTIGYAALIARAHALHRRYLRGAGG